MPDIAVLVKTFATHCPSFFRSDLHGLCHVVVTGLTVVDDATAWLHHDMLAFEDRLALGSLHAIVRLA